RSILVIDLAFELVVELEQRALIVEPALPDRARAFLLRRVGATPLATARAFLSKRFSDGKQDARRFLVLAEDAHRDFGIGAIRLVGCACAAYDKHRQSRGGHRERSHEFIPPAALGTPACLAPLVTSILLLLRRFAASLRGPRRKCCDWGQGSELRGR